MVFRAENEKHSDSFVTDVGIEQCPRVAGEKHGLFTPRDRSSRSILANMALPIPRRR